MIDGILRHLQLSISYSAEEEELLSIVWLGDDIPRSEERRGVVKAKRGSVGVKAASLVQTSL